MNYKYNKYKNKYFDLKNDRSKIDLSKINQLGGQINVTTFSSFGITENVEIQEAITNPSHLKYKNDLLINNPYDHPDTKYGSTYNIAKIPNGTTGKIHHGENPQSSQIHLFCNTYGNDDIISKPPGTYTRILSYNVHNLVKSCNPAIRNNKNLIDILEKVNPDIIFCQELAPDITAVSSNPATIAPSDPNKGTFVKLSQELDKKNYIFQYFADTKYNLSQKSVQNYYALYNGIFSKYKFLEVKSIKLGPKNRVCVYSLIERSSDIYLACFNIHIEYNQGLTIDGTNPKKNIIANQVEHLIKIIYTIYTNLENNEKYKDKITYILGGDFNFNIANIDECINPEIKKAYTNLKNFMFLLNPFFYSYNQPKIPFSGLNTHKLIDYFFVEPPNNKKLGSYYYYILPFKNSDHYPILYDLVLYDK
jgi:endonuclease/exonuclease/phosphatase family metal-dependent hydrolase